MYAAYLFACVLISAHNVDNNDLTMAKLSVAVAALLTAHAAAFAPPSAETAKSALSAKKVYTGFEETAGVPWDPMGLYELGSGEAFDTFPNMFPDKQFLEEAEIKHGRQAMLAWTGIWATTQVSFNDNGHAGC